MPAGRDPERAAIAALLDAARTGHGGAGRGVVGSGKSTLLTDALTGAADVRALRTSGVESESPLAFAALRRLLWPLRGRVDALPGPQRAALGAVPLFAARDGDARGFDAGDLPTVVLGGVTRKDADALLSARAGADIDPGTTRLGTGLTRGFEPRQSPHAVKALIGD